MLSQLGKQDSPSGAKYILFPHYWHESPLFLQIEQF